MRLMFSWLNGAKLWSWSTVAILVVALHIGLALARAPARPVHASSNLVLNATADVPSPCTEQVSPRCAIDHANSADNLGTSLLIGGSAPSACNFFGTDITGTRALGNLESGVDLDMQNRTQATRAMIGGTAPSAGNVLSGNHANGIQVLWDNVQPPVAPSLNKIVANRIGTDVTGSHVLGNGSNGILFGNLVNGDGVGGTAPGVGNVIGFSGLSGVLVGQCGSVTVHVEVTQNSFFANNGLGIDLAPRGIVDCLPGGSGPKDHLPCPVIKSATLSIVSGLACPGCRVEVYQASPIETSEFAQNRAVN
jgi:hypothetical protein